MVTTGEIKALEFAIIEKGNNLELMYYSYNANCYELFNATYLGSAYGDNVQ